MIRLIIAVILIIAAVVLAAIGTKDLGSPGGTDRYGKATPPNPKLVNFRKWSLVPLGLGVLFLLFACVRVVSPGEVGIPVVLGNTKPPIASGVSFNNPLAKVHHLSIRTEEYTMSVHRGEGDKKNDDDSIQVLGKDGATGKVDATLLFRLDRDSASRVYKELGTNYVVKIIRPTARTCIRDAFANVTMVAAATTDRQAVAKDVEKCIESNLTPRGLILESFQLRDVTLSDTVQNAINAKVEAEQRAAQQAFELDKSKQQAQIRVVEAQGLADSQKIIQSTLTPAYLQYEYIKALQATIGSPNHSTLVLPFDKNMTPQFVLPGDGN